MTFIVWFPSDATHVVDTSIELLDASSSIVFLPIKLPFISKRTEKADVFFVPILHIIAVIVTVSPS